MVDAAGDQMRQQTTLAGELLANTVAAASVIAAITVLAFVAAIIVGAK
jgi:hypothetical protein